MLERKYQIFLSSTYLDLIEERSEVIQALLEIDCIPVGMELFPAADDDQWTTIKKIIDSCDYYILIIGGKYGSENSDGVSYTQLEYTYALSRQIPVLAFIHKNSSDLPVNKVDTDVLKIKKLEDFKNLAKQKMCRFWENKDKLRSQVSTSVVKLLKDRPRSGWIRASENFSEEFLKVGKYISFFTPRRNEFNTVFDATILQATAGDRIDIAGISQRLTFTDYPGIDTFIEKITNGCHFRFLLLHPDSILTTTIGNLSRYYGFSDLRQNILSIISGVIRDLYEGIAGESIDGSIEIRLHRDVFSSLSYHSVNDRVLLGLYYSHISGTHCPTFELKDERSRLEAKRHFENLWSKSTDSILMKVNSIDSINTFGVFQQEVFDYEYFEKGISKGKSNYEPYQWLPSKFHQKSLDIAEISAIPYNSIILDYGCAKGFIVRAFREGGFNCFGCDISNYAINNCDKSVSDYCFLLENDEVIPKMFQDKIVDLFLFIHVLEHLEVKKIQEVLLAVSKITRSIFIEVPLGDGVNFLNIRHENDITHRQKRSLDWWVYMVEENGFVKKFERIINDDFVYLLFNNSKFV